MYVDMFGKEIEVDDINYDDLLDFNFCKSSYCLKDNTIQDISYKITQVLVSEDYKKVIMCNIQIPDEDSQFDVLFVLERENQGCYQSGIKHNDLIISIMRKGAFGFKIGKCDTSVDYYKEKLNVKSELLTKLFNEIRKEIE